MSRTFYIKNTQAPKVMTTEELLNIAGEGYKQFIIGEGEEEFDQVMQMPLNEFGHMLFGQEDISGRGFECSYSEENNAYAVRVFTPSTEADWLGAIKYINALATYLNTNITDEEEREYEVGNIDYDYLNDIKFGLKCYDDGDERNFIFGVSRPICIPKEIIKKINAAEDKVKVFDDFVEAQQQHEDVYIAKQTFYKNDKDEIRGVYTLTKTVPTILPYQYPPFIDITKVDLKQEDIKEWRIFFVDYDENAPKDENFGVIGDMDYKTFLERLPEDKIQKLDGHYMRLQIDTKEEMKALLGKKGFLGKIKSLFE